MEGDHRSQQFGNYQLLRLLGTGGFAEVYLGHHVHLGTRAAIKVLHTRLSAEDIAKFKNEAQTIARLIHPHIVRVLDYGIQGYLPFLVMDYAPGGSLRTLHPKGSRVPLPIIVSHVRQVATALQYAHDQRVIHRDIKPDNMLLDQHNRIMLSDFGMALIAQSSRHQYPQEIAGTAAYMAPEQFQGQARRPSDQYALAVVVYEWLCGEPPFHGSFIEVGSQHLFTLPPSLRARLPQLPAEVERVIFKALAKDPLQRFESMRAFALALEEASRLAKHPQESLHLPSPGQKSRATLQKIIRPHPGSGEPSDISTNTNSEILSQHKPLLPPASPEKIIRPRPMDGNEKTTSEIPSQRIPPAQTSGEIVAQQKPPLPAPSAQKPHATPGVSIPIPQWLQSVLPSDQRQLKLSRRALLLGCGATGLLVAGGLSWQIAATLYKPQGTLLYTYREHAAAVTSIAWSPDGTRVASASVDDSVQTWDAMTGAGSFPYQGHTDTVNGVAWSPDGTRIASASNDKTVQVWYAAKGANRATYTHTDVVYAVAWSPNSILLASACNDHVVRIWNDAQGANTANYDQGGKAVRAVAWSPNSQLIASGGDDRTAQVWDAASEKLLIDYKNYNDTVLGVAWSPDGKWIASCSADTTIRVWNTSTGETAFSCYGHNDSVTGVAWSPNGKWIASSSADRTVRIWDVATHTTIFTYKGHGAKVNGVAWSPNGKLIASASSDGTVQVWQAV
ncbi:MAG TPA: serine/threonine-protein kinase [Ktedonosporobacter sp.]|nr:serine/threonine-protein kinase [Ktedonosporobacter sp.]